MTRVACVIPSLSIGGAERSLVELANLLQSLGARVTLVVFAPETRKRQVLSLHARIEVLSMGCHSTKNPLLWYKTADCVRRLSPDVVVGWSFYANLVAAWTRRLVRTRRLILSERLYADRLGVRTTDRHGRSRITLRGRFVHLLYRRADVITANSRANLRYLRALVGPGPAYKLLPNTISVDSAIQRSARPVDLPVQEGPKILALGRLHWQKGFDVLFRALAIIRKKRNWSLVLAGDGPDRDSLRALAAGLGINDNVAFVGPVDDPYPYYAWADMVVVPSRYEGFANVVLEAMACGKPVVATDCRTGPREVTAMGQYGVLVPVDDATSLARAVMTVGENQRLSRQLGTAAQEHIRRHYDHAAVIPSIRDIVLP